MPSSFDAHMPHPADGRPFQTRTERLVDAQMRRIPALAFLGAVKGPDDGGPRPASMDEIGAALRALLDGEAR